MGQSNHPQLVIRPMAFADIPAGIGLSQTIRQQTYLQYEKAFYSSKLLQQELELYSTRTFSQFISDSDKLALVAEEGAICGLAIGKFAGGGIFDLNWICVASNFQRQGVGKKLFEVIERECLRKNCHKLFAYTFRWLAPSIEFYKSCGLAQEAVLKKHWHKLDFLLMSKMLG